MATYVYNGTSGNDYYDHSYNRYYNVYSELVNDPLKAQGLGGDDFIYGNYLNDTIDDGAGNDYLDAGYGLYVGGFYFNGGNDSLIGGTGNDFLIGDSYYAHSAWLLRLS